jgi:hypothetical protein
MRLCLGPDAPPAQPAAALASLSAMALVMARFWPFERLPLWSCPLRRTLGLPCPSCGMTRAFVRVTHGDLAGALEVSPLGTMLSLASVLLVAYIAVRLTVLRRGLQLETSPRERQRLAAALLLAVLANWSYLLVTRAAG